MADYETPLEITIPIPTMRPRQSGVHSSIHAEANRIYVRCNPYEATILAKACTLLEISEAAFARDCMINAAEKIVEHHNAYLRRNRS